jgi:hypothetical protein
VHFIAKLHQPTLKSDNCSYNFTVTKPVTTDMAMAVFEFWATNQLGCRKNAATPITGTYRGWAALFLRGQHVRLHAGRPCASCPPSRCGPLRLDIGVLRRGDRSLWRACPFPARMFEGSRPFAIFMQLGRRIGCVAVDTEVPNPVTTWSSIHAASRTSAACLPRGS